MKTKLILATMLATAMGASFAAAPTAALNHDPATYRNVTQKAAADYKAATAKCAGMSGNAKVVCTEEAKAARAHADADALAAYNNTAKGRIKARTAVADADFALAKAKCADLSGADKDNCINNATAVRTAAIADARADRNIAAAATADGDVSKADAIEKCARIAGDAKTGCLIDKKGNMTATTGATTTTTTTATTGATTGAVANRTEAGAERATRQTGEAIDNAADNTRAAAATAAEKTRNAAAIAADKTRAAAATVAEKTRNVAATAADKTREAAATTAARTGPVVADTVITTKVKAEVFKEAALKSMAIHVETENGVVMLSGFVDSKADADKAVKLANSVEGVKSVKSAIKVK